MKANKEIKYQQVISRYQMNPLLFHKSLLFLSDRIQNLVFLISAISHSSILHNVESSV